MKLYRNNGERWYCDERGIIRRIARWLVWCGGWEAHRRSTFVSLRQRLAPDMLAPTSFFGHRITFYGWGWQARAKGGYWVCSRVPRSEPKRIYWSPNGTPSEATIWWKGVPDEIISAAEEAQRELEKTMRRIRGETV